MPDENDKPATKADISILRTELKNDISLLATKTELREAISLLATKTELADVKTELKGDIARLDQKIDRVAVALVNTQADVREIRNDMATKMATKDDISRVLSAIDAFTKKSEINGNAVVLHGQALTDVQVGLKDHEGRLKTLESARP